MTTLKTFDLFKLPTEIQYQVLDTCPATTLVQVMQANRRINGLVKDVMASRMTRLCGLPSSLQALHAGPDHDDSAKKARLLLRAYSPEDLSSESTNWFDVEYVESNVSGYTFDHEYDSQPSTAFNSDDDDDDEHEMDHDMGQAKQHDDDGSDEDMRPSTPSSVASTDPGISRTKARHFHHRNLLASKLHKHAQVVDDEIVAQSKFRIKSHLKTAATGMYRANGASSHPLLWRHQQRLREASASAFSASHNPHNPKHIASVDIVTGDMFGQVVLQLSLSLPHHPPQLLLQKTQRVYSDWTQEPEYVVHNKELSARLQVVQSDAGVERTNDFGEVYTRYEVLVEELVVNTAYLLWKSEVSDVDELVRYRRS